MSYAVLNVDDPVGKTVGRRRLRDAPRTAMGLQRLVNQVRRSQGFGGICRKGVFRFHSFQEADEWLTKEIAARADRTLS
jgi:hypothetical protein